MLSNKHIHLETAAMEEVRSQLKDNYEKAMLKSQLLIIKLLHNIRTNMVSIMKHYNIALIEPAEREDTSSPEKDSNIEKETK